MSHSQRQKKRSSQFKQKHFEARSRADGDRGKKESKPHTVESPGEKKTPAQPQAAGKEKKSAGEKKEPEGGREGEGGGKG